MRKQLFISWFPYLLVAVIALVALREVGLLEPARLAKGARNSIVFTTSLFPPNLGVLPTISKAMLETIQIAFVGTLIGFVLALPIGLIATRTLFSRWVTSPARIGLSIIRTIPSLLWGLIFVIALGLGPGAGTMGIAFYTLGFLGKLYYEAFEGVDNEVLEAVKGVGCNRPQLMRYAVLPEAMNNVLSQLLFIFEYNVRASTIMGFVGAGGIGFYMLGYIQMLQYQNLMTTLLVTLVAVLLIDYLSGLVRSRFLPSASLEKVAG